MPLSDQRRKYLLFGALALLSAVADQASKAWVQHHLPALGRTGMSVIGRRLVLVYAQNPGIAFSQLQSLSGGRDPAELGVAGGAGPDPRLPAPGSAPPARGRSPVCGLIWGGALGNVIDRIGRGSVTDFVLVNLGVWPFNPWPVFNVADAVLVAGVALFALGSLRAGRGA